MEEQLKGYIAMLEDMGEAVDQACFDAVVAPLKGILGNPDARLVAASDPSELETVRRNFVEKKLGVSGDEAEAAVNAVAEKMSSIHQKPRVVFYYLLCKELGKTC